jgi:hypothetical protein
MQAAMNRKPLGTGSFRLKVTLSRDFVQDPKRSKRTVDTQVSARASCLLLVMQTENAPIVLVASIALTEFCSVVCYSDTPCRLVASLPPACSRSLWRHPVRDPMARRYCHVFYEAASSMWC